ncbi:hypothetical protein [Nonomuraea diastatica]|uniref:hypothetical protein n=1 Tax=Nonomuraea diastatica TaxID=1848329 RepID=UPI001FE4111E|nr:hypothetical protein [Nonomuraea diastatica]
MQRGGGVSWAVKGRGGGSYGMPVAAMASAKTLVAVISPDFHQVRAIVPPGHSTRCSSASALGVSGT